MMNTSSPQNSSAKDMLVISPVFQNDPKRNSVGFRCRPFPFWTVLKKSKVANAEKVKKKLSLQLLFQDFLFSVEKKQVFYLTGEGEKSMVG